MSPSNCGPTNLLVTVKTYPNPSRSYIETVCTAGITETMEWVRLYPVDFRYQSGQQQFAKYQWVQVDLVPRPSNEDKRKESRRPDLGSLKLLGTLSTKGDKTWSKRRQIIDMMPHSTLEELRQLYAIDYPSLGIVRPAEVLDLTVEEVSGECPPGQQALLNRMSLFGGSPKPLRKIPFTFRYKFRCEGCSSVHELSILDWELGALYLKEERRLGSQNKAVASVKKRFLDQMCASSRDTRFFVGTRWPYPTWMILGVFWPPARA